MAKETDSSFIQAVAEGVSLPFIVLDSRGLVKTANRAFKEYFKSQDRPDSLFDLFLLEDQPKIQQILFQAEKSGSPLKEVFSFKTTSKKSVKAEITVSPYLTPGEKLFCLSINPFVFAKGKENIVRIGINNDELDTLLGNAQVLKLIENIRSAYPFTLISKSRIQTEINKSELCLWVKDNAESFIVANSRFANLLRMKPSQLEGKPERNFLPVFYLEFHKALGSYIRESLSTLVINGFPLQGLMNFDVIEVPLLDTDNNVLAVICIARPPQAVQKEIQIIEKGTSEFSLELLHLPAVSVAANGSFTATNSYFRKEFKNSEGAPVLNLDALLPQESRDRVYRFLESNETKLRMDTEFISSREKSSVYSMYISKQATKPGEFYVFISVTDEDESFEELIKKKGKMHDSLIRYNPDPIYIYDAENLHFVEVNEAALSLYGYRREEFLQMDLTDLYTPEDIQTLLETGDDKPFQNKFMGPFKHKKKDGSAVFVEIFRIKFKYENRDAHFNIVRDISERLEKERQHQLFQAAFENTGDLIFITDQQGFIQYVNQAAVTRLQIKKEDILDSTLVSLMSDEFRGVVNTSIYYSHLTTPVTLNVKFSLPSVEHLAAEITAAPILNHTGSADSFCIIAKFEAEVREVIREVPVEKEVIKEVIKEVAVSGGSGNSGRQGTGSIFDQQQISTMFHEILTPINVMLGFIQEIKDSLDRPSMDQQEALDYINQNRDDLLRIMNSIAEYSGASGEIADEPQVIKITDVLETVLPGLQDPEAGLNKEFTLSKISSSLKFETLEKLFISFTELLLSVSAKITKEEQIYISAQTIDHDTFSIGIKDSLARVNDDVVKAFETIFVKKDYNYAKTIHISRFTLMTLTKLMERLFGRFEITQRNGKPFELSFVFPILFEAPGSEELQTEIPALPAVTLSSDIDDIPEYKPEVFVDDDSDLQTTPFPPYRQPEPVYAESFRQPEPEPAYEAPAEPARPKFPDFDEFEITKRVQENPSKIAVPAAKQMGGLGNVPPRPTAAPPPVINKQETPAVGRTRIPLAEIVKNSPPPPALEPPAAPPPAKNPFTATFEDKKTINLSEYNCLYIEDQVDSQILFKVQMKELKDIKFAVSFEEALPLLTTYKFDFIVMDINLQGEYNGLDSLKMIHQMPGFHKMPIVAVTAYVLPGDREKFIAAGFNDFISKPIFREKMISVLEKIFGDR